MENVPARRTFPVIFTTQVNVGQRIFVAHGLNAEISRSAVERNDMENTNKKAEGIKQENGTEIAESAFSDLLDVKIGDLFLHIRTDNTWRCIGIIKRESKGGLLQPEITLEIKLYAR